MTLMGKNPSTAVDNNVYINGGNVVCAVVLVCFKICFNASLAAVSSKTAYAWAGVRIAVLINRFTFSLF